MLYEHFTSLGFCAVFAHKCKSATRMLEQHGAVFVGAAYSALGLPQTDRTRKRCKKHKQTLLRHKSCQAILRLVELPVECVMTVSSSD